MSSMSSKDKKLLVGIVVILCAYLFYQFVFVKFETEKTTLEAKLENIQTQYDLEEKKRLKVPKLIEEIKVATDEIALFKNKFYGDIPQENLLYFLQDLEDESSLDIKKLTFLNIEDTNLQAQLATQAASQSKSDVEPVADNTENNSSETSEETSEETAIVSPVIVSEPMKTKLITVEMEALGTYEQYKKLLNITNNNKEKVVINQLTITRKKKDYLYFPGYEKPPTSESENLGNMFDQGTFDNAEKEVKETVDIMLKGGYLESKITLSFYLVPSINKYVPQPDIHKWELKSSKENLFEYFRFLEFILPKELLYKFEADSYMVTSQGADNAGEASKLNESDKIYTLLKYTFNESSKNPKVSLDLNDKNIVIDKPVKEIGMNIYSSDINNSKLYIVVQDANNKEYAILLAEKLFFDGFATISKAVDENMKYPVKVKRIIIAQDGEGNDLRSGFLKFDFIYTKR